MNNSNKFQDYLIIIIYVALATITIFVYNQILGVVSLLTLAFIIYYINYLINKDNKEKREFIEEMDMGFDEISKNAIFSLPFPIMVMDENGNLKWYNTRFKKLFNTEDNLVGTNITSLLPEYDIYRKDLTEGPLEFSFDGRYYHIYTNITETSKGKLILSYAVDNTDDELVRKAYLNEQIIVIKMIIDNYDEVKSQTPENQMPYLSAEIDRKINEYFQGYGGYTKKYENDRYMIIIENQGLEEIRKNNFKILDYVMDTELGNKIPATLSIGVGISGENPDKKNDAAEVALDMALGRGGEQAVIKDGEKVEFFGGRTQSTTRRNTVRSRVFAHALSGLMDDSNEVYVMGHKNPDMDSLGACLGIYTMVQIKGKSCKIILDNVNDAIRRLYDKSIDEIDGLKDNIIKPEQRNADSQSLVVIVDNNRYDSVEDRKILEQTEKIVVIDHHRRGGNNIQGATLSYIDPNASSSSRMITEMLQYMFDSVQLPKIVAEALLAGITVDTKNFNFQTTSRTFEAASFLKRQGANSMRVKDLFKDDFDTFKYKSEAVSNAEIYDGNIAISIFNRELDNSSLIASQAADELLDVRGVEASFVITRRAGRTHISGRSVGNISVQIILEKLGGGGHLTASATQMDLSLEEAYNELIKAIEQYKEEDKKENESNIN